MTNLQSARLYVVGFIAIFYFMAIRPQQRQRRAHDTLVSSVKKGDRIVTVGGLYGTVRRVDDASVMIEVAKGVRSRSPGAPSPRSSRTRLRPRRLRPSPAMRRRSSPRSTPSRATTPLRRRYLVALFARAPTPLRAPTDACPRRSGRWSPRAPWPARCRVDIRAWLS